LGAAIGGLFGIAYLVSKKVMHFGGTVASRTETWIHQSFV